MRSVQKLYVYVFCKYCLVDYPIEVRTVLDFARRKATGVRVPFILRNIDTIPCVRWIERKICGLSLRRAGDGGSSPRGQGFHQVRYQRHTEHLPAFRGQASLGESNRPVHSSAGTPTSSLSKRAASGARRFGCTEFVSDWVTDHPKYDHPVLPCQCTHTPHSICSCFFIVSHIRRIGRQPEKNYVTQNWGMLRRCIQIFL